MRVSQSYTNLEGVWARKLTLRWPNGNGTPFSYDLGGVMRGGDWDGQMFCAEVKWRRNASDQGPAYKSFPAKCYVALSQGYMLGDHYMWISWAPFRANDWDQLTSPPGDPRGRTRRVAAHLRYRGSRNGCRVDQR